MVIVPHYHIDHGIMRRRPGAVVLVRSLFCPEGELMRQEYFEPSPLVILVSRREGGVLSREARMQD